MVVWVNKKKGFTLVEIMIVVAIIGLLSIIGLPNMLQAAQESRSKRFARDIQTAAHAFAQYTMINVGYPADMLPAQIPAGMADYLNAFPWADNTCIGGQWDWDYNVFSYTAGVAVKSPNRSVTEMRAIDDLIDDGNLSSGNFQSRPGGYVYILED